MAEETSSKKSKSTIQLADKVPDDVASFLENALLEENDDFEFSFTKDALRSFEAVKDVTDTYKFTFIGPGKQAVLYWLRCWGQATKPTSACRGQAI